MKRLPVFNVRIFLEVKYCSLIMQCTLVRINWGIFSLVSISGIVTLLQDNVFGFHLVNMENHVTDHISLNLFAARKFSIQSMTHLWQKTAHAFIVCLLPRVSSYFQAFSFPFTSIFSHFKKLSYLAVWIYNCILLKLFWNQSFYI